MTPAHQSPERRWRVIVVVAAVVAVVAVFAGTRSPAPATPGSPASLVGAPDAESTAWYCTGQSTGPGVAHGELVLTNTESAATAGTVTEVSDTGAVAKTPVAIPARGVVVPSLAQPASGSWLSQIVTISGGGVAVTQEVRGSSGWSESPCQSTTSSTWFFPSGTTAGSAGLFVSLLNPTSTPVVVDLAFVTPAGTVHPVNYQGIVLPPDGLQVLNVASEVQNVSTVSTVVQARTGRIVASEVQVRAASPGGLSVVPGAPRAEAQWTVPQAQELSGGLSELDVFNPGTSAEEVTVRLRLASGPLHPLSALVQPGTTWALSTSRQTRIPDRDAYTARVDASGGAGVVVGRLVVAPGTAPAPQLGVSNAVDGIERGSARWPVGPPAAGHVRSPGGQRRHRRASGAGQRLGQSRAFFALRAQPGRAAVGRDRHRARGRHCGDEPGPAPERRFRAHRGRVQRGDGRQRRCRPRRQLRRRDDARPPPRRRHRRLSPPPARTFGGPAPRPQRL